MAALMRSLMKMIHPDPEPFSCETHFYYVSRNNGEFYMPVPRTGIRSASALLRFFRLKPGAHEVFIMGNVPPGTRTVGIRVTDDLVDLWRFAFDAHVLFVHLTDVPMTEGDAPATYEEGACNRFLPLAIVCFGSTG